MRLSVFPRLYLVAVLVLLLPLAAKAEEDSVVVFNEIHYHPDATGTEWIELRNLMGVNVDLSGWKIRGGVDFTFPAGSILPGRGYLIVASTPGHGSLNGTGAVGPFSGQLSNSGESIRLENMDGRVMDVLEYGDSGAWPVAADGGGVTLSKRDQGSANSEPSNWTASAALGGTPGKPNFQIPGEPPVTTMLTAIDSTWRYFTGSGAAPAGWNEASFDDSGWSSGPGLLYAGSAATDGGGAGLIGYWPLNETGGTQAANLVSGGVTGQLVNGPVWVNDAQRGRVLQFDGANDYVNAGSATVPQMTLSNDVTWSFWTKSSESGTNTVVVGNRYSPSGLDWNPREFIKFTTSRLEFHRNGAGDDLDYPDFPTNTWVHHSVVKKGGQLTYYRDGTMTSSRSISMGLNNPQPLLFGGAGGGEFWQGLLDDVALWGRALSASEVSSLASGTTTPGTVGAAGILATELPLGATTYYFRRTFQFSGSPNQTALALRLLLDDGAIVYLNGQEIHRANMPAGAVGHDTFASSAIGNASLSSEIAVSATALVQGANVLAVEVHQQSTSSSDMVFGLSLVSTEQPAPVPSASPSGLVLNEIAAGSDPNFQVELANLGDNPVDLAGYVVAASSGFSYTLTGGTLNPGGYLALDANVLGFIPADGDRLFLYKPGRVAIADAQTVTQRLRARSPQFGNAWLRASGPTFGTANAFSLNTDIVINEIMYHPRAAVPGGESDEQWIELYNRSASSVDLSGWSFNSGITYLFPAGTVLGPGQYLVVARNSAALRAKYPAIIIVGDWTGNLSRGGERLRLVDANENPVDELTYFDGGRWPEMTDGYGPSLELRHPDADNAVAESWAPSDEGAKSSWQNYTFTGVGANNGNDPTTFNEFVFGLLDAGEVLIDDISVKEVSVGNRELIQNGSFSGGNAGAWRLLGTHRHAEVIDDPSSSGNKVLYIRASGASEHMHNHAETTLKSGGTFVPLNSASTYTISFRARWLSGSNQLNTRLYFNRLARTSLLPVPTQNGTPGAQNSRFVSNTGPTFTGLRHEPAVPGPGQSAMVSVAAADADGVTSAALRYNVNDTGWALAPMSLVDGRWTGTIPAQAAGAKVQFYVQAVDGQGTVTAFPAGAENSRAMIPWEDGQAILDYGSVQPNNIRIVLTQADTDFLHTNTNVMSNDRLPCTVIYNEREVYYDCGVRLKGSQRGRNQTVRVGFNLRFPTDNKFLGTHEYAAIDRSGSGNQYSQKEILVKHAVNRAGGIPGMYDDLVRVIAPRTQNTGAAMLQKSRFNDEWLDNQFSNGSDGRMFEYELIYSPNTTVGGTPEGLKIPEPDSVAGASVRRLGTDKELHRWHWLIKNNRSADDYSGLMTALDALEESASPTFHAQTKALLDVDQWLRAFAIQTLFGVGDSYAAGGQHNAYFFIRPTDGKMMYFPWDMDFAFSQSATGTAVPSGDLGKLINDPGHKHAYYAHLLDLVNSVFNRTYMAPWAEHYSEFLPSEDLTGFLSYIDTRRAHILSAISTDVPQVPFQILTPNGQTFSGSFATIQGDAWVDASELRLAGASGPLIITWISPTRWQVQVPIIPGVNTITIEAFNRQGDLIGTRTVTVNGTGTVIPASAANLVISEIMYNPAAPSASEIAAGFSDPEVFEFIEVLNISATDTINLGGVRFAGGIDFAFPTVALAPGARALAVGHQSAFQQRYGAGKPVLGAYQLSDGSNRLANSGEQLLLLDAGGQIIRSFAYDDNPPWPQSPDGGGWSLVLIAPASNPNHADPMNWRASTDLLGNPATGDATVFSGNPTADDDGDGISNLVQYALAGTGTFESPRVAAGSHGFLTLEFRRNLGADDIQYTVERSLDLQTWSSASGNVVLESEAHNGDGTASYIYRSTAPLGQHPSEFLRLRITQQP